MPAAIRENVAIRACSRCERQHPVGGVGDDVDDADHLAVGEQRREHHVPVRLAAGDRDRGGPPDGPRARRSVRDQLPTRSSLPGMSSFMWRPGAVYSGGHPEVVLVEPGPRLVAALQPHVGAEHRHAHGHPVEEQLEQLLVERRVARRHRLGDRHRPASTCCAGRRRVGGVSRQAMAAPSRRARTIPSRTAHIAAWVRLPDRAWRGCSTRGCGRCARLTPSSRAICRLVLPARDADDDLPLAGGQPHRLLARRPQRRRSAPGRRRGRGAPRRRRPHGSRPRRPSASASLSR